MRFLFAVFGLLISFHVSAAVDPISIAPAMTNTQQPQVSITKAGSVHVVFGTGNSVFNVVSTNEGLSFSQPHLVGKFSKLALGRRRGPRVSANDDVIVVTAISAAEGNLYSWHSQNGNQWSDPSCVNDRSNSAREGLHGMAGNERDTFFVAWLDLRNGQTELWGSASYDGAKTWQPNILIYKSTAGHICECCHPSVIFLSEHEIAVMWRNWLHGSRDMFVAVSRDNGKTFGEGMKLGRGTWPLNACPMDGGALINASAGEFAAAWRRESSIYLTIGAGAERLIGKGAQPVLSRSGNQIAIAWEQDGRLMFKADVNSPPKVIALDAAYPAIASFGTNGANLLVWETNNKGSKTIVAQRLE